MSPHSNECKNVVWVRGITRRFVLLAGSRAITHLISMAWFLLAARLLTNEEFGLVATGLVFATIFAAIGDLGTTRTVVRYVAADHRTLWFTYRRSMVLRVAGGIGSGVLVTVAVGLLPSGIDLMVVVLGAMIATAAGMTEIAYAALRAVGRVRAEFFLLILERSVFLGVAMLAVVGGAGALVILAIYAVTNLVSAILAGTCVRAFQPEDRREPGALFDREARFTAVSYALVTLTPRLAPLLVALAAMPSDVGAFAVAQRPVESLAIFSIAATSPLFPIVRERFSRGEDDAAMRAAVSVVAAIGAALGPLLAWFVVSPTMVVSLLYGHDRYSGASAILRLLSFTAMTWVIRSIAEAVLLSQERASMFLAIVAGGALLTLSLGYPAVVTRGAQGVAAAVVVAEMFMTMLVMRLVPALAGRHARAGYWFALAVVTLSTMFFVLARGSPLASVLILAIASVVGLGVAMRAMRGLDLSAEAAVPTAWVP